MNKKIFKIFFSFPIMYIFYLITNNSFKGTNLSQMKFIFNLIFMIQISVHFLQLFIYLPCTPSSKDYLLNKIALLFGIIHFLIIAYLYNLKKNKNLFIPLIISIYMIISHIITIQPGNNNLIIPKYNLNLPINDLKSYILLISYQFHEKKAIKILNQVQDRIKNKSIIDAGAYIGDTSIFLSLRNKNQKIYAIESSIKNYNFIKKIKDKNKEDLSNLIVLNQLLSDNISNYSSQKPNLPNSRYNITSDKEGIKSTTLDQMWKNKNEEIGLLHFDVEGFELKVIKGSIGIIKKYKPFIMVETTKSSNKEELFDYLINNLNYKKVLTVNESCSFGDVFDKNLCRNHLFYVNEKVDLK
jgi:FkbM family methyltransferase